MKCPRCNGTRLTAVPTGALMDASEYQIDCLDCGVMWRAIRGGGRVRPTPAQEAARIKEWANVTFVDDPARIMFAPKKNAVFIDVLSVSKGQGEAMGKSKRTFEVWRDGDWVDCKMQDLRCGDRFRGWEDAAKTELAGGMLMEGMVARSDPFEREPGLWALNMEGEAP